MACAALGPNQDAVGGGRRAAAPTGRIGFRPNPLLSSKRHRQRNPQASQRADLQEAAPRNAFARANRLVHEAQHRESTPVGAGRRRIRLGAIWRAKRIHRRGMILATILQALRIPSRAVSAAPCVWHRRESSIELRQITRNLNQLSRDVDGIFGIFPLTYFPRWRADNLKMVATYSLRNASQCLRFANSRSPLFLWPPRSRGRQKS